MNRLEVVPRLPVPKLELPIVTPTHKNIIGVHSYGIYNRVMAGDIPQELVFRALPDFYVVGGATSKGVLPRMKTHRSYRFLVICEDVEVFSGTDIPGSHCCVLRS